MTKNLDSFKRKQKQKNESVFKERIVDMLCH